MRNKFSVLVSTSFVAVHEKKEHLGDRAFRAYPLPVSEGSTVVLNSMVLGYFICVYTRNPCDTAKSQHKTIKIYHVTGEFKRRGFRPVNLHV